MARELRKRSGQGGSKLYLLESEVEQVDGLSLDLAAFAQVLEDNARWVIPQKEPFEFHFVMLSTNLITYLINNQSTI